MTLSMGDSGHPCMMPRNGTFQEEKAALIWNVRRRYVHEFLRHVVSCGVNPISSNLVVSMDQGMVSKNLEKSSAHIAVCPV